jgi:serine protease 16
MNNCNFFQDFPIFTEILPTVTVFAVGFLFFVRNFVGKKLGHLLKNKMKTQIIVVCLPILVFSQMHTVVQSWFEQKVDHFDLRNNGTWFQRFYYDFEYWGGPGSPIFFQLGWESELGPEDSSLDYYLYHAAKEHQGVFLAMEHRFYGQSLPFGPAITLDNLKYLTTEQALADFAYFVTSFMEDINSTNSKLIVDGCSYSGELAAFFRIKYPNLVTAAIAGSPNANHMSLDMDRFFIHAAQSIDHLLGSTNCTNRIKEANQELLLLTQTDTCRALITKLFNLCYPLQDSDIETFFSVTLNAWYWANIAYDSQSFPLSFTILQACPVLTNQSLTAVDAYATVYTTIGPTATNCMDASYQSLVNFLKEEDGLAVANSQRQDTYECCNELGSFLTTSNSNQPWVGVPVDFYVKVCQDVYGITPTDESIHWTWTTHYGMD